MNIFICVTGIIVVLLLTANIVILGKLIPLEKRYIEAVNKSKHKSIENDVREINLNLNNMSLRQMIKVPDEHGFIRERTVAEAIAKKNYIKESDLVDEDKSEFLETVDKLVPEETDNNHMFKGF